MWLADTARATTWEGFRFTLPERSSPPHPTPTPPSQVHPDECELFYVERHPFFGSLVSEILQRLIFALRASCTKNTNDLLLLSDALLTTSVLTSLPSLTSTKV
jgi:hypothetical protein